MRLNKPVKIVVGILTLWPLVYGASFVAVAATSAAARGGEPPVDDAVFIALHASAALDLLGLYVFYIIHARKNKGLGNKRDSWLILFVFLGLFAMPVYWIRYVWPRSS
jgi:hypothetical protein